MEKVFNYKLDFNKGKHTYFRLYDDTARCFLVAAKILEDPFKNEMEIETDNSTFEKQHLEIVIEFYSESNWAPRTIEKVISQSIEDHNLTEAEYAFVLKCNNTKIISKVYECASYFNLTAAVRLCFLIIGVTLKFDPENLSTLTSTRKRLKVDGVLDPDTAMSIQKKHMFLLNGGEIEISSEEDDMDMDEEFMIEENLLK